MSLEDMTEAERNSEILKRLMNHPEVGREAKRLWKKVEPRANFPDLDLEDQVSAATKALNEKVEKLEQERIEDRVRANREANHKRVRDAGFEVEQVEKVMTDEKIANYDTAIKYLQGQSALAPPTPEAVTPIRMPDNLKDIQKNPAQWARNEAFKAINELKAQRAIG
jgi:hypothetical protein